jgi:hypothetical protein
MEPESIYLIIYRKLNYYTFILSIGIYAYPHCDLDSYSMVSYESYSALYLNLN